MAPVRAVVSDLDGTFWSAPQAVHRSTMPAVAALTRRGVPLLFATGRRFTSAHRGLAPHRLLGPTVLMSGSVGSDLATGEEWHRRGFEPDVAMAVLAAFRAAELSPVVYVGAPDLEVAVEPGCASGDVHLAELQGGGPHSSDLEAPSAQGRVVGFGVCAMAADRRPAADSVAAAVASMAEVHVGPDQAMGGYTLLVAPPGVSKVDGILGWLDRHDLGPDELMAVGDGSNDVEMLRWAGTAVGVRGGMTAGEVPGLILDAVIDAPEDGGWAQLLDLL